MHDARSRFERDPIERLMVILLVLFAGGIVWNVFSPLINYVK